MELLGSDHKSQITNREWLDYPQFAPHFAETIQGELEILPAVGGGDDGPNAGLPARNGREPDSLSEYARLEQPVRKLHSLGSLADDNRGNGAFARPGVEAARLETALEEAGVVPQAIDQLRLGLEDLKGREAGTGYRGRVGCREQERSRPVVQKFNQRPAARDVAA